MIDCMISEHSCFSMLVYLVQNISVLDFSINNIAIQTLLVNLLMNLFVFNIVVSMPIVFY